MINMDSQIPNKVVKEWIEQGNLFGNVTLIRPETVYKNSRFDPVCGSGRSKRGNPKDFY